MPKVSIVTVAYNSAATITDTLRSVAKQTHPDIEHIIVDGASLDDTMAIVRREGAHVARTISEPDRGIYDAMSKGLALATGDWVGFLNADDMLADCDTIANMMTAAARVPAADVLYGDLLYVAEADPARVVRYWRSGSFTKSRLRFGWMPPHPTFYVRTELARSVGTFADDMRIAADYDYILRCLARTEICVRYLPEVLVRMRTGGASNRSFRAILRKSREDLRAMRRAGVGGIGTLLCKNLRKVPQFFVRQRVETSSTL